MAPQLQHFSARQRVVSVDLRGHGASDKPLQTYSVAGFADDLAWLCEQLNVARPIAINHQRHQFPAPNACQTMLDGHSPDLKE
ncbi:MAG: alpha/beta fold hydrolase [Chloroflexota bacterium]